MPSQSRWIKQKRSNKVDSKTKSPRPKQRVNALKAEGLWSLAFQQIDMLDRDSCSTGIVAYFNFGASLSLCTTSFVKSLGLIMVRWPEGMAETNIEDLSGHFIPLVGIVSIFVSGGEDAYG
jgi:hypothetical protein